MAIKKKAASKISEVEIGGPYRVQAGKRVLLRSTDIYLCLALMRSSSDDARLYREPDGVLLAMKKKASGADR